MVLGLITKSLARRQENMTKVNASATGTETESITRKRSGETAKAKRERLAVESTAARNEVLTRYTSAIAIAAGTVWTAKLQMGLQVIQATAAGFTLLEVQEACNLLPFNECRAIRDVCSLECKKASGLQKLARIASVLGADITNGKHSVTTEQVARWQLSTEDAVKLARRLTPNKDGKTALKVSTLAAYCREQDGGKASVRALLVSTAPPSSTLPDDKKTRLPLTLKTFKKLESLAKADKVDIETFILGLLDKK